MNNILGMGVADLFRVKSTPFISCRERHLISPSLKVALSIIIWLISL